MKGFEKYQKSYFMPPTPCYDWVYKDAIDKAPIWCSVDLRDGNQALIEPMGLEEKLQFFKLLVKIGFKEIEVGFPAASETEYIFLRRLIEDGLIPDDVTVQVLTQAREHIIRKTFEAVDGAPNAIVHVYNSTSVAQREQVFKKSKEEIKKIAVDGAMLLQDLAKEIKGSLRFEYSPESFHGTETEYGVEVCNAVLDVWKPDEKRPAIINIPSTVENAMPHVFASQVEYVSKNLHYREHVALSLHPHNDRGTGIATAELGVLAGADRIEGTLFGNGERTGNMDILTMAMNLFSHGVDPELEFSDMKEIVKTYENLTGMDVSMRQPYAGSLVFTAFSGSHQDAIAKGMQYRKEHETLHWSVPYLPIDPQDVGRTYDSDVIRINSQSGKGGVSYVLKQNFGIRIPDEMKEEVGYLVKDISDHQHAELEPGQIREILLATYKDVEKKMNIVECHFKQLEKGRIEAAVTVCYQNRTDVVQAEGSGRLDAVSHALMDYLNVPFHIVTHEEHGLKKDASSKAMSYVGISYKDTCTWGIGIEDDSIRSLMNALCAAINRIL